MYTTTRSPSVAKLFRSSGVNSSHGSPEKLRRSFLLWPKTGVTHRRQSKLGLGQE
ncbi:hypothetical protein CROQUDRAFT_664364 [Cronartium quercuum f. sp. fusiforme G11]|uniref:Uncharacterized protein n=1 Tax=Cronartium quercuum f. sp. fusiforme G11 TaxID=708437 RepID=A0A9P6NBL2_9BASI|nr:hypothetical protein CROQUDRAFT_664364 [Cronartium quercuum f. sp. fusiforme G11]